MVLIICGRLVTGCAWIKARQSLHDRIVDALLRVGPGFADAADGSIDQSRVALAQIFHAKPKPFHRAGPEVLHQHVGAGDQPRQHLASGRRFHVDRQRTLAAVR
jgi:hypothetical protein